MSCFKSTIARSAAILALALAIAPIASAQQINQVYMMFRARLLDLDFGPGAESLDVCLFEESEVPWEMLAFRTIGRTLRNYFLDRKLGTLQTRVSALERRVVRADLSGAG